MSTITTLVGGDGITSADSMVKINTNFSNLNTDKIETSYLDTDTTLAANSDTKIATQKAVKTYVDTQGGANASASVRGIVELATAAEITAGTATGGSGAALAITPDQLKLSQVPIIRKYLTADSPATWTKPSGLKYVIVETQGAGGTGGTGSGGGGGGGGGAYSRKVIAAASCGSTETVTIGAGGVGSGNTSFGALLVSPNGADASGATGGAGGTASGGDVDISGGTGQTSSSSLANAGGHGGSSVYGNGGVAGGFANDAAGAYNGESASGYGGGGGGGGAATDGSPTGSAGEGTAGIVIVTEFYS